MNERLFAIIQRQQEGHENEPRFMIGEQLKEIAAREQGVSEILERDLEIPELSLEAAERKLQQCWQKAHPLRPGRARRIIRWAVLITLTVLCCIM